MCITGDFLWSMEFGVDCCRRLVVSYFLCGVTGILSLFGGENYGWGNGAVQTLSSILCIVLRSTVKFNDGTCIHSPKNWTVIDSILFVVIDPECVRQSL